MATGRLVVLDLARVIALIGMAAFHFVFDLVMFGHLPPETVQFGFWPLFARLVAGSFLFLAGVSLWLGHGVGIRWPSFWRRFAVVAAAAAVITIGTYVAVPENYIFFGILHSIALASLVGLLVLRLPVAVILALAAAVVAMKVWGQADVFNAGVLRWTGLGTQPPSSMDYVPVFPWLAPYLAGLALSKLADAFGLWGRAAAWLQGPGWARVTWPGRHSLVVYLVHQPLLIGLIYAATWWMRRA